jgi:hypothetical protein
MAFLDNSGDIILDAVLTDTGRARLAKGDGSFRIVKFALADDEIDYSQYRNSNHPEGANPSGSAYYDLEILMTPILEAFTNNSSSMKSKVLSIPRNNLLYLPVLKLNTLVANTALATTTPTLALGIQGYYVTVDEDTQEAEIFSLLISGADAIPQAGVIKGAADVGSGGNSAFIKIDQGLDTEEISSDFAIDNDLLETQYIVEIDNRFGSIVTTGGASTAVSYIDDDNIARYFFSLSDTTVSSIGNSSSLVEAEQVIAGPRGTTLEISIRASLEFNSSDYLFQKLGSSTSVTVRPGEPTEATFNYYFIDSIVRVMGATTGYKVDIPVRFVKLNN